MKKVSVALGCLVALLLSTFSAFALPGPADYVYMPSVGYGEKEIDFKAGTIRNPNGDRLSAASLGFGYGATQRWFTEFYTKYNRSEGRTDFDAFEWENKFQITETGEYPIDVGFITEIERPKAREEGYEVKFGPLFQTEFGKTQLNGNLLFVRNYRAEFSNTLQMIYQWQAKYRLRPEAELGFQGFGELGDWNGWSGRKEQTHRVGPALFGKVPLGGRHTLRYNAAFLIDVSAIKQGNTLRVQVEYEF